MFKFGNAIKYIMPLISMITVGIFLFLYFILISPLEIDKKHKEYLFISCVILGTTLPHLIVYLKKKFCS